MKDKIDDVDKQKEENEKRRIEQINRRSHFSRLLDYNRPRINIFIGIFVSVAQGGLMPIFGGVMAKMLFVLMEV